MITPKSAATDLLGADRCPRCGGGFHCGAQDAHCDCFTLQLPPGLREEIARTYPGACLCLRCLKELGAASKPAPPTA